MGHWIQELLIGGLGLMSDTLLWGGRIDGLTVSRGVHNQITEVDKLVALERLCVVIGPHLIGGTIFDSQLSLLNAISDKKVSDIDVFGSFRT